MRIAKSYDITSKVACHDRKCVLASHATGKNNAYGTNIKKGLRRNANSMLSYVFLSFLLFFFLLLSSSLTVREVSD